MSLTQEQIKQVETQLRNHDRADGIYSIPLDPQNHEFLELQISRGVFGSDIVSSGILMVQFLHNNPSLYVGKKVHDMGCGPGTLGLHMTSHGTLSADLADVNPKAADDALKNAKRMSLNNVRFFCSDLFTNVPDGQYEVVPFNHPFFRDTPENFGGNHDSVLPT